MRFTAVAMAVAMLAALGCRGEVSGPSTAEFHKEREALMARLDRKRKTKGKKTPKAAAPASTPIGSSFGVVDVGYSYDPTGKRDPFRSFEWERPDSQDEDLSGPLEQFDVSQLSVVAVVWKTGNARALVQDPSGQSYIIREGTKIGKNEGRVIQIGDNLVVVKETYVDYLGQETTKDVEMRIRRSEGG